MNPKNTIINELFPDNQVKTVWSESFQIHMAKEWWSQKKAWNDSVAKFTTIVESELKNPEHWDTSWLKEKYPERFK